MLLLILTVFDVTLKRYSYFLRISVSTFWALSETKLGPENPKEPAMIMGYEHKQRERTCRAENNLELICVERKPPQSRPFLIVAWYRPPNGPVASFDKLEEILNLLDKEDKEIILLGDTNCDLSQNNAGQPFSNNDTKHLCNIYELFSFKQLINKPTRVILSSSTLDHISTTAVNTSVQSGVSETSMSDHFMVLWVRKLRGALEKNHKVIQALSMKKINEQAFVADVASICWGQIASQCTKIDLVVQEWSNAFSSIIEKHAPIRVSEK